MKLACRRESSYMYIKSCDNGIIKKSSTEANVKAIVSQRSINAINQYNDNDNNEMKRGEMSVVFWSMSKLYFIYWLFEAVLPKPSRSLCHFSAL